MQRKSINETGSFGNSRLFLLSFIILILIVLLFLAQAPWNFFVILFLIVVIFSTMLFWQQYVIPDLGIAEHLFLTKYILMDQFTRSPLILSIRNGEIKGDYLLLKNKPEIKVLNIDHKSAVLIEDASNRKTLLLNGIHILRKNPKIHCVFDLGIRYLHIGPSGRMDLGSKYLNENLAEYHLRKEAAERTKTKLSSGNSIYPSFSIFYRIVPASQKNKDIILFQSINEKIGHHDSDPVTSEILDDFIIFQLLKKWSAFCVNKSLDEILAEFPNSYEISFLNDLGIISRITLDQIYK